VRLQADEAGAGVVRQRAGTQDRPVQASRPRTYASAAPLARR
jgi:hypothetical protein